MARIVLLTGAQVCLGQGEDEAPRSGAFVDTDLLVETHFPSNNVVSIARSRNGLTREKLKRNENVKSTWTTLQWPE